MKVHVRGNNESGNVHAPDDHPHNTAKERGEYTGNQAKRRVSAETSQCKLTHETDRAGQCAAARTQDVNPSLVLTFPIQSVDLHTSDMTSANYK